MKKFFKSFIDLIYKKKCYFCFNSKYSLTMCPECYDKLQFCNFEVNRIIDGVDVYCAGVYTKELQKLIRGLKYHKQKELAFYQAKFMYEYFQSIDALKDKNFELIPVPLHKNRIKSRRYNHMELVCKEFSLLSGFKCNFNLIERIKDTKPQYKLSRAERLENLQHAFTVNMDFVPQNPVLIFDDICTTGATFEEIIKELKSNGINEITCFATSTPVY
ncbi:MAG: ComF family protein [bacterium]|nr:ComF family protein [bacterium]